MRQPVLTLITLLVAATAAAQDVAIDNSWVHVVRLKQAPHGRIARQEYPPAVVVYLTDARQRITSVCPGAQESPPTVAETLA